MKMFGYFSGIIEGKREYREWWCMLEALKGGAQASYLEWNVATG